MPAAVRVCVAVASIMAGFVVMSATSLHAGTFLGRVTIRVYGSDGIARETSELALQEAAFILAQARVDTEWRDCAHPAAHGACATPVDGRELLVRLSRAPANEHSGRRRPLGYSLIDTVAGRGQLATIYLDRVEWLALQGGVARGVLLGRAIAHEVGHLMLGSQDHSEDGLMRALWTASELARNTPADWLFSPVSQGRIAGGWLGGGSPGTATRQLWLGPQR